MRHITAFQLHKKHQNEEILLIDVRQPAEYRSEHIEGSCLIALSEISYEKVPSYARPIVVYCRSGRRSVTAMERLLAQNPKLDVSSLDGGIIAWKDAGYAVKRSGRKFLPVDQQTQIVIGILNLTGITLGTFVSPVWYGIPVFLGCGLIFAGSTGWCGMARLLAHMPWNR